MFSSGFCEISKNTYSYRTPLVATASVALNLNLKKCAKLCSVMEEHLWISSSSVNPSNVSDGILVLILTHFDAGRYELREKYPNAEFFPVRIFPHLDWIRRDTKYLFVFIPDVGKRGPEKTPYLDTFHAVIATLKNCHSQKNIR